MSTPVVDAYLDELLAEVANDEAVPAPAEPAARAAAVIELPMPAPVVDSPAAPEGVAEAAVACPPPVAMPAPMPAPAAPAAIPRPPAAPAPAAAPAPRLPAATAPVDAPPTRAASTASRWLRVGIGADHYAFELLRVQEVVRLTPIVAMRGAHQAVLGVMNLRGRIVPVFDLGRWLGAGCVNPDERARIVVVERDDDLIGVLVSAVEDVVTLGREHIEPPLSGSAPGAILGIARVHAPTVLLDANALFEQ